jgi:hypothetical protein
VRIDGGKKEEKMEGNDSWMIKRLGGVNKVGSIDSSKLYNLRVVDVRDRDLCSNCRSGRSLREKSLKNSDV